jgi:hypothetical protein
MPQDEGAHCCDTFLAKCENAVLLPLLLHRFRRRTRPTFVLISRLTILPAETAFVVKRGTGTLPRGSGS